MATWLCTKCNTHNTNLHMVCSYVECQMPAHKVGVSLHSPREVRLLAQKQIPGKVKAGTLPTMPCPPTPPRASRVIKMKATKKMAKKRELPKLPQPAEHAGPVEELDIDDLVDYVTSAEFFSELLRA